MIPAWIIAVGVVVVVLGVAYGVRNQINGLLGGGVAAGGLAVGGSVSRRIWWHVDDSQANAREWLSWGDRTTREPNEPYLKICLERARRDWTEGFELRPLVGRAAALAELREAGAGADIPDGVERCPPLLWMAWCRAAFMRWRGGLWMDGSVLPVGGAAALQERLSRGGDLLMFGSDSEEGLSAPAGSAAAAGASAAWSAAPGHPVWRAAERDLAALVAAGAPSWSAVEARRALRGLWDRHFSGVVRVDRTAELSRDMYGVRLELDTLLGETDWPTGTKEGALWVPWPEGRDGLERATPWLWFVRMSAEQIREAPFLWAQWARG
jgi:hypothetical protein